MDKTFSSAVKKMCVSFFLQSNYQQQSTRAGTTGTEFCKLRPADLKGGIGRTEYLSRGLSKYRVSIKLLLNY